MIGRLSSGLRRTLKRKFRGTVLGLVFGKVWHLHVHDSLLDRLSRVIKVARKREPAFKSALTPWGSG